MDLRGPRWTGWYNPYTTPDSIIRRESAVDVILSARLTTKPSKCLSVILYDILMMHRAFPHATVKFNNLLALCCITCSEIVFDGYDGLETNVCGADKYYEDPGVDNVAEGSQIFIRQVTDAFYTCVRILMPFVHIPTTVAMELETYEKWVENYADNHLAVGQVPVKGNKYFEQIDALVGSWKMLENLELIQQYDASMRVLGQGSYGKVKSRGDGIAIKSFYIHGWRAGLRECINTMRLGGLVGWCIGALQDNNLENLTIPVYMATQEGISTLNRFVDYNRDLFSKHIKHLKHFVGCLLEELERAHDMRIVHRDLTPWNVVVVRSPDDPTGKRLRIIDWGMGKAIGTVKTLSATTESGVGTLCIRPPELLLHDCTNSSYDRSDEEVFAGDVWAVGVIVTTMALPDSTFFRATNEREQWDAICDAIGSPTREDPRTWAFLSKSFDCKESTTKATLWCALQSISPGLCDFVRCMLRFDPDRRLDCSALREHPFLSRG